MRTVHPYMITVPAAYLKNRRSLLANWLFVFLTRVWKFVTDLPPIDRIGAPVPIPKKTSSISVDTTQHICLLLTSIYKLNATHVFQKVCDCVKEYATWSQAGFI